MGKNLTFGINFKAFDGTTKTIDKMSSRMGRFMKTTIRNSAALNSRLKRVDGTIKNLTGSMGSLIAPFGALSATGLVFGGIDAVKTAAELESLGTSIKFAAGNAKDGADNLNFLRQIAMDMAIDYKSAAEGFKMFSANFIGQNVNADEQRKMFEGVSKAIRVMGLDAEKTESVFRALGEIVSKGKLMSQELKLQLANAMPGTTQNMARALGFDNVSKLYKAMEDGAVDGITAVRAFTTYAGKAFEKGMPDALKTTQAQLTKLANKWLFFKQDLGNMLVDTGVIGHLDKIVDKLGEWFRANKELIGQKVTQAIDWVVNFGKWVVNNWESVKTGIISIAVAVGTLKAAIMLTGALGAASNPLGWIVIALGAVTAAAYSAYSDVDKLRESLKKLDKEQTTENIDTGGMGLNNMVAGFTEGFNEGFFKNGNWEQFKGGFKQDSYELLKDMNDIAAKVHTFISGPEALNTRLTKLRSQELNRKILEIDKGLHPSIYPETRKVKSVAESKQENLEKRKVQMEELYRQNMLNVNVTKEDGLNVEIRTAQSKPIRYDSHERLVMRK